MLDKKLMMPLSVLLLTAIVSTASYADHSWGKYKWKPSSIPFNLELGDNVDSTWDNYLNDASTDWSESDVLTTNIINGSTDPISCNPESGNVQVCNADYGNTGWLGIAQIYGRGTTITAGVAKLNDYYYNTLQYDTPGWRRMVMCQEVAHDFGLDHQDESFNNPNLGTCMDYTDDPDGTGARGPYGNNHPNQHDYDQLVTIYSSNKRGEDGGGGCNPKSPKCNPASAPGNPPGNPRAWGRLVSGHGGIEVFEKDLGNGNKVITHVTWTLEHANYHSH